MSKYQAKTEPTTYSLNGNHNATFLQTRGCWRSLSGVIDLGKKGCDEMAFQLYQWKMQAAQMFEDAEERAFHEFAAKTANEICPDYFTKEFHEVVKTWMNERAAAFRIVSDANDKADHPPARYSYYHPYLIDDANYSVAIVTFMHINRRHAMSADGWALLQSERVFKVKHGDLKDAFIPREFKGAAK